MRRYLALDGDTARDESGDSSMDTIESAAQFKLYSISIYVCMYE